jgi:hypothetical protein
MVEGCTHTKQTFWTEDEFTVTASAGIRNRDVRVAEIVVRELEKTKPDKWGCVQAREIWSPPEERQVRPGHFWLLKFGKVPGSNSCVEKKFKLGTHKYEEYKGVCFGAGDYASVICYMSVICLVLGGVVGLGYILSNVYLCNHMLLQSGGGTWGTDL